MIYNKKIRPVLVDQNIIGEYMQQKILQTQIQQIPLQESETKKLFVKIFYNTVNFFYHYFFIITIFIGIIYFLYKRYLWYQDIKKQQKEDEQQKDEKKISKYFDKLMTEDDKSMIQNNDKHIPENNPIPTPIDDRNIVYSTPTTKLDKIVSGNNRLLSHLKSTIDTTQVHTSTMGRIITDNSKSVRFAQSDFDAYGRNSINPKTGETVDSSGTFLPKNSGNKYHKII